MNSITERLSLSSRLPGENETTTPYSFFVQDGCMAPLLSWNDYGETDKAIITRHPQEGDVGVLHFLKNKKWFTRFGIWGPLEEKTGRRLILSLNPGKNHGPIWGVTEEYTFDQMYVIGVLHSSDYQQLFSHLHHKT